MAMSNALAQLAEITRDRHAYPKAWKERTGGQVLGYTCTYVPEEIAYAAGILPVRIFGDLGYPGSADRSMGATWCGFSRSCVSAGLDGHYDYLGYFVSTLTCIHMTQMYEIWQREIPGPKKHFIDAPWNLQTPAAPAYWGREMETFRKQVEEWRGEAITDEALDHAFEVYNTNRRLLHRLYETRKSPAPPITGAEVLEVVLAGFYMDKADHNQLLEQLLGELEGRQLDLPELRGMLVGSELNDVELVRTIEQAGMLIVTDDECAGTRYFWNEVIPAEDRILTLAQRYIDRPRCPLRDWTSRTRIPHIMSLAREYNVSGVIFALQKFCDPHGWETPVLEAKLKEEDIPTLRVEMTFPTPYGPIRTRVEAFMETLLEDALF
jgi:benzoyl-CoA reductase subunit C